MQILKIQEGLAERIFWLVKLRWIAAIGVIFTVLFTTKILKFSIPEFGLYSIAIILIAYNLIFLAVMFYIRAKLNESKALIFANRIANLQISLDLSCLAFLIHFSGGIENPFIFYFIFHMIIASILLSRRASILQTTLTVLLFSSLVILEYFGIIPHYCLKGFIFHDQHTNIVYIIGVSFVFISTLYIAVYMATSISAKLREHQESLKRANELLNEKDRIKSEYVLRVTHDIKEHLSAIQGCIEPVMAGITGQMNDKQLDLLKRADERSRKLMSFVKALLGVTRIKLSKHIEMQYFSLRKSVENAVNFVDMRAKDKGIIIDCSIDKTIDKIKGAEVYIEETIANLLANSVKYTPKDGRIDISLKDKGDNVLIQISDTGIGIPKDEITNIFEEFYRARNAKKAEHDGTGLGLSIAKQVIERHGGKIWVESQEGKGSTFSIILPK